MKYPFQPKSTAQLKQGQYWCFRLCDGRYVAGAVLARVTDNGKIDRRLVWAGLLDWTGSEPPRPDDLVSVDVVERGAMHIRSIWAHGEVIAGEIARSFRDIPLELPFSLAATPGWPVWGLDVIRNTAELRWGDREWVIRKVKKERESLNRNNRLKKVNIDV